MVVLLPSPMPCMNWPDLLMSTYGQVHCPAVFHEVGSYTPTHSGGVPLIGVQSHVALSSTTTTLMALSSGAHGSSANAGKTWKVI